MKKIDFHVHTLATISDVHFDFSLQKLKEFVEVNKLDCIAITNHNRFNLKQFEEITKEINNCTVLPGVEVDLENGHMLIICDKKDVAKFERECKKLEQIIISNTDYISYDDFIDIFKNYGDYLLIPHIDKKPKLSNVVISKFGNDIICGEVSSNVKWQTMYKKDMLLPLIFSDIRIEKDVNDKEKKDMYSSRHMYIDCEEITVKNLKLTFKDKTKVHINADKIDGFFEVDEDIMASTGLNIILGKRSSGKTYLLKRLAKEEWENVKYIKQFELSASSADDAFDEKLNKLYDSMQTEYCKELDDIVKKCSAIKNDDNNLKIKMYLTSLLSHANNKTRKNAFAKVKVYTASEMIENSLNEINKLIISITNLLDTEDEYKKLINKAITSNQLIEIYKNFVALRKEKKILNLSIRITNGILKEIQSELKENSNVPPIKDINIVEYATDLLRIEKFNNLIKKAKRECENVIDEEFGFKIVQKNAPFSGPADLNTVYKPKVKFADAFSEYDNPFEYLQKLKLIGVEESSFYKLFFKVTFEAQNKFGNKLSGGERSEYLLLNNLKYNELYDVILLDEPESSFDNVFLNTDISKKVAELSKNSTVFITTHNPNLGVQLQAKNIIYTENDNGTFKKYYGSITSPKLKGKTDERGTYNVLMNLMEAGEEAYRGRKEIYEGINDN